MKKYVHPILDSHGMAQHENHLGLTKLEWFAGMAMKALADPNIEADDLSEFSEWCFDLAEAMLAESQKREEGHSQTGVSEDNDVSTSPGGTS